MEWSQTSRISSAGPKEVHCAFCSFYEPVLYTKQLKAGQHIKLQGQSNQKYDPKSRKQTAMYDHHAIIESVERSDRTDYRVTMTVIHYADVTGKLVKEGFIKREKREYNLQDSEIYIVKYPFCNSTADDIIKRARLEISPILVDDVSMLDKGQSIKIKKQSKGKFQFALVTSVECSSSKTERRVCLLPYTDQNECLLLGNLNEEVINDIDLTCDEIYIVRDVHPEEFSDDIICKLKRETNGFPISDTSELKRGQHLLLRKKLANDTSLTNRFQYAVLDAIDITVNNSSFKLIMCSDSTGKVVKHLEHVTIQERDLGIYDICLVRDTDPQESDRADPYEIHNSIVGMLLGNKFKAYKLVSSNCEHFAVHCVVGGVTNFQENGLMERLTGFVRILSGESSKLLGGTSFQVQRFVERLMFIIRLVSSEVPKAVKVFHIIQRFISNLFQSWFIHALPAISLLVFFDVYAIYALFKAHSLTKSFKNGLLCKSCYERQSHDLVSSFLFFTGSSFSGCMILYSCLILCCATTCFVAPVFFLLSIFTCFGVRLVLKHYRRHDINIEIRQKQMNVTTIRDICRGDIIIFKYFKFWHYALVTGLTKNSIEIIHYNFSGLTRTIVRDTLTWLKGGKARLIKKVDTTNIRSFEVNEANDRISLAESRLGEQKWHPFKNRSDHLCQWVLVKVSPMSYPVSIGYPQGSLEICGSTGYSSFSLEDTTVYVYNEISRGDVVKLKSCTGLVFDKRKPDKYLREFKMSLLVNNMGKAERITIPVNLNKENVYKKQFRPVHCCDKKEIENRMKSIEGEYIPEGLDLVTLCVARNFNSHDVIVQVRNTSILDEMENNQIRVMSIVNVDPGDIIVFKYYGRRHYALVTNKEVCDIHLIHPTVTYGGLRREIARDKICWGEHNQNIWKVDISNICSVQIVNPNARINRAEKGLGEKTWNTFKSRSKHFCAFLLVKIPVIFPHIDIHE